MLPRICVCNAQVAKLHISLASAASYFLGWVGGRGGVPPGTPIPSQLSIQSTFILLSFFALIISVVSCLSLTNSFDVEVWIFEGIESLDFKLGEAYQEFFNAINPT